MEPLYKLNKIKILLTICLIILVSSCGSKLDDTSAKQKELELKEKELE